MKENKYDDKIFFEKYSEMSRSKNGLTGAGEWSELQKVLPDFHGKRVLDLGCGYGWHCIYAAQNGAESVLGIDISERMLAAAEEKNGHESIEYRVCAMEDLEFPDNTFDIVLSSLAFHYVKDFQGIVRKIQPLDGTGGNFVFSAEHGFYSLWFTGLVLRCRGEYPAFPC